MFCKFEVISNVFKKWDSQTRNQYFRREKEVNCKIKVLHSSGAQRSGAWFPRALLAEAVILLLWSYSQGICNHSFSITDGDWGGLRIQRKFKHRIWALLVQFWTKLFNETPFKHLVMYLIKIYWTSIFQHCARSLNKDLSHVFPFTQGAYSSDGQRVTSKGVIIQSCQHFSRNRPKMLLRRKEPRE